MRDNVTASAIATERIVATIYKICAAALWREAERAGVFTGAPVDLADGFIHFSTAAQVRETAARHFAGADGPGSGGGRCRGARGRAALGALARRRVVSASLWHTAALRGALGESRCRSEPTDATCFRSSMP